MGYANRQVEAGDTVGKLVELTEVTTDQDETTGKAIDGEIDSWARRALSANGFGDY